MYNSTDFFQEIGNRDLMQWLGTPCFITKNNNNISADIKTVDGIVYEGISFSELEEMNTEEMCFS